MNSSFLFEYIHGLSNHYYLLDQLMIFSARYLILISFILTLGSIRGSVNNKKAFLLSIFSLGISLILVEVIRMIYYQPRPFLELNFIPLIPPIQEASFPSEHTISAFTLAWSYLIYRSKLGRTLLVFASLIGFSRIYVGVHYPLDILGGVLISLFVVLFLHHFHKLLKRYI